MEDALKSLEIDLVDNVVIGKLRNKHLGITARDLLYHLLDRYGEITPADVKECQKK